MTLKGKTTITGSNHAKTLYLTIPANIAKDSQFNFKPGDTVSLEYDPGLGTLTITKKRGEVD